MAVPARPPRLLDQVRVRMRACHYSRRIEQANVAWIRRFIFFHRCHHPRELETLDSVRGMQHIHAPRVGRSPTSPHSLSGFPGSRMNLRCYYAATAAAFLVEDSQHQS
jgi:hypothetical protein